VAPVGLSSFNPNPSANLASAEREYEHAALHLRGRKQFILAMLKRERPCGAGIFILVNLTK